jgi:hypothetical protein
MRPGQSFQGTTRNHHLSNVTLCLRYLESVGVPLVNIGATDVVDGNESSVLGLVWRVMQHFFSADLGGSSGSGGLSAMKHQCLAWLKHRVPLKPAPSCYKQSYYSLHY